MSDEELLKMAEEMIVACKDAVSFERVAGNLQTSLACSQLVIARNNTPKLGWTPDPLPTANDTETFKKG